jgi:hypothetical protein
MSLIVDYSVAKPTIAQLKAANVTSVGRYIGWDGVGAHPNSGKNITGAELAELHAANISVFVAFEYSATAALNGKAQGLIDGALAVQQMAALGAPEFMGVYFAVDFDVQDYAPSLPNIPANAMAKLGPVGEYFYAIKTLRPSFVIGVYGGYWTVKRVLDAELATLSWQTIAWSGGNQDSRINLLQTTQTPPIAGLDINTHVAKTPSWGQWNPTTAKPPVPPVPPKPPAPPSLTLDIPLGVKKLHITLE